MAVVAIRPPTLGDALGLPRLRPWQDAALVVGISLLVAGCAQISVYLPFSPVPISAQTLAVLLAGATLGSRRGALVGMAYLGEGLAGLPVFAGGQSAWTLGRTGIPTIMGPTAGYLAGFVAGAFVVGWLAERGWDRRVWSAVAAMAIGNAVIYAFGLLGLARFVPADAVLAAGVLPFLPGDAVKIAIAASVLPSVWSLVGRGGSR